MRYAFIVASFLALAVSDSAAQAVTIGVATDGAITAWQYGVESDPSKLRGAVSVAVLPSGLPAEETLGASMDEMRTPRWRWNGKAIEVRDESDIRRDRKRKIMPRLVEARAKLQAARDLQKEDGEAVTDGDIEALQADADAIKALLK